MNLFGRNDDNEPRGQQFNNQPPRNGPPQRSTSGPSSYGPAGGTGGFYGRSTPPEPSPTTPRGGLPNAAANNRENNFYDLKRKIQTALIAELDPKVDLSQTDQVRKTIEELFNRVLEQQKIILQRQERQRLLEAIAAEILGFGPIEPLLEDESVSEIMINGPHHVYTEQHGRIRRTDVHFRDDDHVMRLIDRIISPLGRRCDEQSPYVDARLPDGSRVNAVIAPISLVGPVVTIRKFSKQPLQPEDLVRYGTVTMPMLEFLRACVHVKLNVVISGGTGSGKTTLLNVLSEFIPEDERIVTSEDAAELQLQQDHVVRLESRPLNIEGTGRITIRDLVANALRMRPDRIVVGECRGGEAIDMLQAMNTGHDGSLTTLHSNSPRDTLARLETISLMAGMDLPLSAIRTQVASALHRVIHQERMRDGTRKITHITEVLRMQGEVITTQDLFLYEQMGIDDEGHVIGRLRPTGLRPSFMDAFEVAGIHLPPTIFGYGDHAWDN